jgi:hypothetical protein
MYTSPMYVQGTIDTRYRRLLRQSTWARRFAQFRGHANGLRSLAQALEGYAVRGQRDEGYQSVDLGRIVGSEGRCEDFDNKYRPLKGHTEQRWYRVARAMLSGVVLPPVVLIRIGDEYYVRDGNHRVSVARAFGQAAIEAEVTVYQLVPQAGSVRASVAGQGALAAA